MPKFERAFAAWCCVVAACIAAAVVVALATHHRLPGARYTPDVSYPHTGSCVHPDKVVAAPCAAVRELLLGANTGSPRMYCRHYAQPGEYPACIKWVAFSDPGYSAFQSASFRVRSATVIVDGDADVLVHVWPFDDPPSDAVIVMERKAGWWRVIDVKPPAAVPAA